MIPNQVRFGLNLQDLPVRATQVEQGGLGIMGGSDRCNGRGEFTPSHESITISQDATWYFDYDGYCNKVCSRPNIALKGKRLPAKDVSPGVLELSCTCCFI